LRNILALSLIALTSALSAIPADAQWAGNGPRWEYNLRETMYVGPLQTTGQEGFSFAFEWGYQADPSGKGGVEIWPHTFFPGGEVEIGGNLGGSRPGLLQIRKGDGKPGIVLDAKENGGTVAASVHTARLERTIGQVTEEVRQSALVGPEHGIYFRGSVYLERDNASGYYTNFVTFPNEFFAYFAPPGSQPKLADLTILITPQYDFFPGQGSKPFSPNAYVGEVNFNGFYIEDSSTGGSDYRVDYIVIGPRHDVSELDTIVPK